MNLIRLIILILAIWIAFQIWKNYRSNAKKMPTKPTAIPNMVACAVCKMHIPDTEALRKADKFYCSQQHLDNDN